jgi:hypothetical protein
LLAASHVRGDLSVVSIFHKPGGDRLALIGRQALHQFKSVMAIEASNYPIDHSLPVLSEHDRLHPKLLTCTRLSPPPTHRIDQAIVRNRVQPGPPRRRSHLVALQRK